MGPINNPCITQRNGTGSTSGKVYHIGIEHLAHIIAVCIVVPVANKNQNFTFSCQGMMQNGMDGDGKSRGSLRGEVNGGIFELNIGTVRPDIVRHGDNRQGP